MRMKITDEDEIKRAASIRLNRIQFKRADAIAKKAGVSRSKLFRRAIIKYMDAPPESNATILKTQ